MTSRPESRPRRVFGASGCIGTHLVPRLLAAGVPVRVSSRQPRVLEARGWRGVEVVAADTLDPATLPAALDGVGIAYYLVHSMGAGRNFGQMDTRAAANFAAAAARAGAERICCLRGLVPKDADSEHIVSRRETGEVLCRGVGTAEPTPADIGLKGAVPARPADPLVTACRFGLSFSPFANPAVDMPLCPLRFAAA